MSDQQQPSSKTIPDSGHNFERMISIQADVDSWPIGLRACVHEFGHPIVRLCVDLGVKKPAQIRALVTMIWGGGRSVFERPARGTFAAQPQLDALLIQSGSSLSAAGLARFLQANSSVIVPLTPTRAMITASVETVAAHDMRVTKWDKHRLRLMAALKAADQATA